MSKKSSKERNEKLKQIIELLKFTLQIDDVEILKSSIEAAIEVLQDEIDK